MSEISSRARVQRVSGAASEAALTSGVVLLAGLAAGLLGSLPRLPRQTHSNQKAAGPAGILPAAELAEARRRTRDSAQKKLQAAGLPPLETARAAALLEVASVPYYVQDTQPVRQALGRMSTASSLAELAAAREACLRTIEFSHNQVLANALVMACSRACLTLGFDRLEVRSGSGETTRVIATNPAGKTLVTEITAGAAPKMETEVVGVSDASCHAILDAFDAALEAEGVRSAPPQRRLTGGVCELAAAREFVRRKLRPAGPAISPAGRPDGGDELRRRRRLNEKILQVQRSE